LTLQETVADGRQLFQEVLDFHENEDFQTKWIAWKHWAFRLELPRSDTLDGLEALMTALAMQDAEDWSLEQLEAIYRVLAHWANNPEPTRKNYENWYDYLADREIHVLPW
jgi:hypothetical protein